MIDPVKGQLSSSAQNPLVLRVRRAEGVRNRIWGKVLVEGFGGRVRRKTWREMCLHVGCWIVCLRAISKGHSAKVELVKHVSSFQAALTRRARLEPRFVTGLAEGFGGRFRRRVSAEGFGGRFGGRDLYE